MIFRAFFWGMIVALPFFLLQWELSFSPHLLTLWSDFSKKTFFLPPFLFAFFLAFSEEAVKHFAVLRLGKSLHLYFDQITDGVIYSVAAALGFAVIENIAYFLSALTYFSLDSLSLWKIVIFRSIATMFAHTLFSGIFGLFWGYAFCNKSITPKHTYSVSHFLKNIFWTFHFHIIFSHILRGRPSKHGHEKADLIREALLLATLLHTLFNLFLSTDIFGKSMLILIPPFLLTLFVFLVHQFTKTKTRFLLKNTHPPSEQ